MNAGVLESLIPLCGGIYATLLGYRIIGRPGRDPRMATVVAQLKWLGPLVIAFGLWLMWQAFADEKPDVETIVQGMRERVTLPMTVDEMTQIDAFDHEGQRIIYRMTITQPPKTRAEQDALIMQMRQHLKSQGCKRKDFQHLLAQDITLEFVYTIGGAPYPGIVVTRSDCALG
jgi:hypothetical protein